MVNTMRAVAFSDRYGQPARLLLRGRGRPSVPPVEYIATMKEMRVILGFACCHCDTPVSVTVECSGKHIGREAMRLVACVSIPCPDCQNVNQLYFDPSGRVHAVEPFRPARPLFEPSLN